MTLKTPQRRSIDRARRAFTLAEVLAAMLFMAIVIPVALQGLRVASQSGEAGQRKLVAARLADKLLSELKVTSQLQNSGQSGVVVEDGVEYRWTARSQAWTEDTTTPMKVLTLTVQFPAQGRSHEVQLSTLLPQTNTL
jgi:type II secretory pathway pseudopilin PulG